MVRLALFALVMAFSHGSAVRVVNEMRPAFRRCAEDARSYGKLNIDFVITPKGKVKSVKTRDVVGFDAKATKCMVAIVKAQSFEPFDEREDVNVSIPVKVPAPPP